VGRPGDGRDARLRAGRRLALATRDSPPPQRRPVRMGRRGPLVLADLPVDVVVVLEQQERAGQAEGTERALCER